MNNPKFCDLRVCAKATGEVNTGFPDEEAVKEYRTEFLAPIPSVPERAYSYRVSLSTNSPRQWRCSTTATDHIGHT